MTTTERDQAVPPGRAALRMGANYVPSAGWFYSWLDYSPDAVRRDFEDLAGIGLDHGHRARLLFAEVLSEQFAKLLPGSPQSRLHRTDTQLQHLRRLIDRKPLNVS